MKYKKIENEWGAICDCFGPTILKIVDEKEYLSVIYSPDQTYTPEWHDKGMKRFPTFEKALRYLTENHDNVNVKGLRKKWNKRYPFDVKQAFKNAQTCKEAIQGVMEKNNLTEEDMDIRETLSNNSLKKL